MTHLDAIGYLNDECDALPEGPNKDKLQYAIDVLNDEESTSLQKQTALQDLNDIYWDVELQDQNEFGQATFCESFTVDPNKPFPKEKI